MQNDDTDDDDSDDTGAFIFFPTPIRGIIY